MSKEQWMVLIIVLLTIVSIVIPNAMRKKYQDQFVKLFSQQKFDELEQLLNKKSVRYFFMPFNLEYIRLNMAFIKGDEKAIDKQFEVFDKISMNTKQKEDLFVKEFNYYIMMEDYDKAQKPYEAIQNLKNEQIKKAANITYDIFVKKGHQYLEEIEKGYEECPEQAKGYNAYLISLMYENKGDKENSEKYRLIAKEKLEQLPEKEKQNEETSA